MTLPPFNFDITLLREINSFHPHFLDPIMIFIANISEYAGIWVLIGIYFLFTDKKNGKILFLTLALALIIEVILNDGILKNVFFRERPYLFLQNIHHLGPNWMNSAFVSGHTASSTAALIILIDYSKKYFKKPFLPNILYSIIYILIIWSRLYLGMHYPTDIIGGIIIGSLSSWLALFAIKKFSKKINNSLFRRI